MPNVMTAPLLGHSVVEEAPGDDELAQTLASYREKKRQALEAARATPSPPPAPPVPSPPEPPRAVRATPGPAAPPAAPPSETAPSSPPAPSGLASVPAPAGLRPSPPSQPLSALGPLLRLSDRLLSDSHVSVRGWAVGRSAGMTFLILGLATLALAFREARSGVAPQIPVVGVPLSAAAAALAAAGLAAAILFSLLPRRRRIAVSLADSQKAEWERVRHEAAAVRRRGFVGRLLAPAGLASVAGAYLFLSGSALVAAAAVGSATAAVGLLLLADARVRRALVRRLYIQTLLLEHLERAGIGPAGVGEPRLGPVLTALDRLMGALPEGAVRAFLASDEAADYLDLLEETGREGRDGR